MEANERAPCYETQSSLPILTEPFLTRTLHSTSMARLLLQNIDLICQIELKKRQLRLSKSKIDFQVRSNFKISFAIKKIFSTRLGLAPSSEKATGRVLIGNPNLINKEIMKIAIKTRPSWAEECGSKRSSKELEYETGTSCRPATRRVICSQPVKYCYEDFFFYNNKKTNTWHGRIKETESEKISIQLALVAAEAKLLEE